jgi:hypothetical protein
MLLGLEESKIIPHQLALWMWVSFLVGGPVERSDEGKTTSCVFYDNYFIDIMNNQNITTMVP